MITMTLEMPTYRIPAKFPTYRMIVKLPTYRITLKLPIVGHQHHSDWKMPLIRYSFVMTEKCL